MEFEINHMPFKMDEISQKLFNLQFLSDITFIVEGKPIYAHSLELMKRSSVFQRQLQSTFGEMKIIPIIDYRYETFYQFIRFIYTDEYTIDDELQFELLKLAKLYNVIRLFNALVNFTNNRIKILNFCVVENYEIALNSVKLDVADDLFRILGSDAFLSIHPAAVEETLKLDHIDKNVQEIDILNALMRWMNCYCIQNQIQFSECRQKFNNLIRLIRFPTMSNGELRDIKSKYPDLLTKSDFQNIGGHRIFGTDYEDEVWNCRPRMEIIWPYDCLTYSDLKFETKFSVSTDMILSGFVFGTSLDVPNYIEITICCDLLETTEINIHQDTDNWSFGFIISMGESIRIKPNFKYTIGYKYMYETSSIDCKREYFGRKPETEITIKAPPNSVHIFEAHKTMLEIYFSMAEDGKLN